MLRIDRSGCRFGRLTVIEWAGHARSSRDSVWLCRCDCGETVTVLGGNLTAGRTVSRGCSNRARITKHGGCHSRVYRIWAGMIHRCSARSGRSAVYYRDRGISVCDAWRDFRVFYRDMGDPPFPGAEIDRIDNDGDYAPGNCRWATRAQQNRNRRGNIVISFDGRAQVLQDWAKEFGIDRSTLSARLRRGEVPPDLFRPPAQRGRGATSARGRNEARPTVGYQLVEREAM